MTDSGIHHLWEFLDWWYPAPVYRVSLYKMVAGFDGAEGCGAWSACHPLAVARTPEREDDPCSKPVLFSICYLLLHRGVGALD